MNNEVNDEVDTTDNPMGFDAFTPGLGFTPGAFGDDSHVSIDWTGLEDVHEDFYGYAPEAKEPGDNTSEKTETSLLSVDDVFGNNTQSTTKTAEYSSKQGDYKTSSTEDSKVKTSTFGNQDIVQTTPTSKTENKGLVDNSVIDSVDGLNFENKNKNEEALEASKKRSEEEEVDTSNKIKEQLKAIPQSQEEVEDFQVGQEVKGDQGKKDAWDAAKKDLEEQESLFESKKNDIEKAREAVDKHRSEQQMLYDDAKKNYTEYKNLSDSYKDKGFGMKSFDDKMKIYEEAMREAEAELKSLEEESKKLDAAENNLYANLKAATDKVEKARSEYTASIKTTGSTSDTVQPAKQVEQVEQVAVEENKTYIQNTIDSLRENREDPKAQQAADTLEKLEQARINVEAAAEEFSKHYYEAADDIRRMDPEVVQTFLNAQDELSKNIRDSLQESKGYKNTNFNKDFVRAIANANDFNVKLPDGSQIAYDEFVTDLVVQAPAVAQVLYENKAAKYAADGKHGLAKITQMKAKMCESWFGSKFVFADNQIRQQFITMSDLNMRATYATYNNTLNDPNATPEMKAEAQAQIEQAKALQSASAALKASTGFFSGIGDSHKDGRYGTTDPKQLNAWQSTLATVESFCKITLGLGVMPGANKGWSTLAALNPDSKWLNRDFDGDGFTLFQEYENNTVVNLLLSSGELFTGIGLTFNPATLRLGINLILDSIINAKRSLYSVRDDAEKTASMIERFLQEYGEAAGLAGLPQEAREVVESATADITQTEDYRIKDDEVGNLDNWLEGSGSSTTANGKFNQTLTYDEWLKLIESDETMREYAKKLTRGSSDAKKDNANKGVNS